MKISSGDFGNNVVRGCGQSAGCFMLLVGIFLTWAYWVFQGPPPDRIHVFLNGVAIPLTLVVLGLVVIYIASKNIIIDFSSNSGKTSVETPALVSVSTASTPNKTILKGLAKIVALLMLAGGIIGFSHFINAMTGQVQTGPYFILKGIATPAILTILSLVMIYISLNDRSS